MPRHSNRAQAGAGYYQWRHEEIQVRGQSVVTYHKPGMASPYEPDVAELLLAENVELGADGLALSLNCGAGLAGAVAARLAPQGRVWFATPNAVDLEATRRSCQANGLANADVCATHRAAGLDALPPQDAVLIRLPKGKLPALQLIWDAYHALKPGGHAYLAGGNDEGIKTYLEHMDALFGDMSVASYRRGHRVGVAAKQERSLDVPPAFQEPWLDPEAYVEFAAEVRSMSFTIRSRPGIFSWDRLDPATEVLIGHLDVRPGERVLDLGCGYGIIGLAAARLANGADVTMLDADVRAVEAANENAALNGVTNCRVLLSDCAAAVEGAALDVIATNPPFHRGQGTSYDMAAQFIADAARLLRPDGRFYLVANRFLPYEAQVQAAFGDVAIIYEDSRFKVLRAVR